jgi:hypothetical protein
MTRYEAQESNLEPPPAHPVEWWVWVRYVDTSQFSATYIAKGIGQTAHIAYQNACPEIARNTGMTPAFSQCLVQKVEYV